MKTASFGVLSLQFVVSKAFTRQKSMEDGAGRLEEGQAFAQARPRPLDPLEVIRFKDDALIGFDIQGRAIPVRMDVPGLFDEDIVEDVVFFVIPSIPFDDRAVRQGLMIGQFHAFVVEMEATTHAAAIKTGIIGDFLQVVKDMVVTFFIEIVRRRFRIVETELDRCPVDVAEPFQVRLELVSRIFLIQYTVDTERNSQTTQESVIRFLYIMLHMARYVDAGNLMAVAFRKGDDVVFRLVFKDRQGRIDVYLMCHRNTVQHTLQRFHIGKRFAASEDKVTERRNAIHQADAPADSLFGKTSHVFIFCLVDAERTMIVTVIRHENRDGSSAIPCLIRVDHTRYSRCGHADCCFHSSFASNRG